MKKIRKSSERGYFENDWLKSYHSFSFADYFDREHMHFRDLRVINHDFIAEGSGFPTHPHRDMEIITYVLRGRVAHKDSMGNQAEITAGEIQVMTAGTGITHSEFNPDPKQELELLQIWVMPNQKNLKPAYAQKSFGEQQHNQLKLIASLRPEGDALKINQDVNIWVSTLEAGQHLEYVVPQGRHTWIQVAGGEIEVNGEQLKKGDAIAYDDQERNLRIKIDGGKTTKSDFVLFDLC